MTLAALTQTLERTLPVDILMRLIGEIEPGACAVEPDEFEGFDPLGWCQRNLPGESYTEDVEKLMDSVRRYQVTVAISANATGKTHAAARIGICFYDCFKDSRVYTAAAPPESNLKNLLWGEIGNVFEKNPQLLPDSKKNVMHVHRSAGSFLTGVTIPTTGGPHKRQASFSGKHAPHMMFIFDEADGIPDEVYKGQESCTSGGLYRVLMMFNPRHESGHVYRLIQKGIANVVELSAFRHPNVVTGENLIPGAVDRNTTARRIRLWARPLREGEPKNRSTFELPEFLEGIIPFDLKGEPMEALEAGWWKITEHELAHMVLGRYPAQAPRQLISREWIDAARARYDAYVAKHGEVPPAGTLALVGIDVAEFGDDVSTFVQRYGGFVPPILEWSGVDPDLSASKAIELLRHIKALRTAVDGTGVGSGVAPKIMRAGFPAHSVKAAASPTQTCELGEFFMMRDQLWWEVREWLRTDPGAMLPPDEDLIEELLAPTYDTDKGKVRVMDQKSIGELLGGRSPNRADGLRHTFFKPHLLYPKMGEK